MLVIPEGDKRPLPILVAEQWDFSLAYVDRDGDPNHYLYCARDWFIGLGGEKSGWAKFDKSWLISNQPVEVKRKNRKPESLEFVSAEDLYRIAANMRAMDKRPQLADIKNYLSKAGVFADQARREPEKTAEQLLARSKGITARNEMTAAAQETHIVGKPLYGALTNAEYEVLFGAAKTTLSEELGISKSANLREHLGTLALQVLTTSESAAATKMRTVGRTLTTDEQLEIVRTCARMLAPSFQSLTDYLGVNRLTNQPALPKGND